MHAHATRIWVNEHRATSLLKWEASSAYHHQDQDWHMQHRELTEHRKGDQIPGNKNMRKNNLLYEKANMEPKTKNCLQENCLQEVLRYFLQEHFIPAQTYIGKL